VVRLLWAADTGGGEFSVGFASILPKGQSLSVAVAPAVSFDGGSSIVLIKTGLVAGRTGGVLLPVTPTSNEVRVAGLVPRTLLKEVSSAFTAAPEEVASTTRPAEGSLLLASIFISAAEVIDDEATTTDATDSNEAITTDDGLPPEFNEVITAGVMGETVATSAEQELGGDDVIPSVELVSIEDCSVTSLPPASFKHVATLAPFSAEWPEDKCSAFIETGEEIEFFDTCECSPTRLAFVEGFVVDNSSFLEAIGRGDAIKGTALSF
jgi:hypothetical protein